MPFQAGTRLGSYEVLSAIGAGGMGEVYGARDTKLNRDVAIKVLPESVASDPGRLARFHREAQVLAALNHPNIAHIYGVEDSGPTHALVMELVEGPTLADRIAQGPIPLEEALRIGKQIAEALEAAHEQGIIHRDLKPANIKVRDTGTVKVLDFGLAKVVGPTGAAGHPSVTESPTITSPPTPFGVGSGHAGDGRGVMTRDGVILGTPAYMSPEQARGRVADKRSDVWAFGAVLYEMLTGKRAFGGETTTDVLAAVVSAVPDWDKVPLNVQPLLRSCLEKDPDRRLRHVGDFELLLEARPVEPHPKKFQWPAIAAALAMVAAPTCFTLVLEGAALVFAQGPVPYLVTTAPLDVGVRSIRVCIAVRNNDVWWWQGSQGGCDARTGNLVQAERVMNTTTETDKRLTFALPTALLAGSTNGDSVPVTVLLHADGETLSSVGPNGVIAQVSTVERPNLNIPEQR